MPQSIHPAVKGKILRVFETSKRCKNRLPPGEWTIRVSRFIPSVKTHFGCNLLLQVQQKVAARPYKG